MLVGNYARLRILDSTDADYVRRLRNSPAVVSRFQYRHFISDVQQQGFVRSLAESTSQVYFVAERLPGGEPFGVYFAREIDHRNQRADNGVFLDESMSGTGVEAFEGAFLLLDYEFRYLNLRKVCAEVLSDNPRALRFNAALGMRQEGVRRDHLFYDGRFHDLVELALFRDDFYDRPTPVMRMFLADREKEAS
jgi:RimJ/RimL family protein N-acetyltransferase